MAKKKHRKHTPIISKSQKGLFGAAYGAKKKGKSKPAYVPTSLWNQPMKTLKEHLTEYGGKKSKKKSKKRR